MSRERFQRLFRGNEDWYGQYEAHPITGEKLDAYTKSGPIPDQAWDRHLAGTKMGMGIVPISDEGTCYWGAIDLDDDNTDHAALVRLVKELGLPLVVCRSKSGGAHLYLFFIEPIKPVQLIAKLKRWSILLKLENPNKQPIEIFPKQISLTDGQKGNWLNLPYFNKKKSTRYGVGEDGEPLSFTQFLKYAEGMRLTENELEVKQAQIAVNSDSFFLDGPPCLQSLHESGFPRGTRNSGLYNVGIFIKLKYPDDWEDVVRDYNENGGALDPPLDNDEVDMIVRSLSRRDYTYKCSDAPIVGFCQRGPCKKQDYGIDRFRKNANEEAFPRMGRLVKFESPEKADPPIYELEVGDRSIQLTPDEFLTLSLFRKMCFRQAEVVVPMIKQYDWDTKVIDLLDDKIVIEIPNDAGPHGQFIAHLTEFLGLRHKSDKD